MGKSTLISGCRVHRFHLISGFWSCSANNAGVQESRPHGYCGFPSGWYWRIYQKWRYSDIRGYHSSSRHGRFITFWRLDAFSFFLPSFRRDMLWIQSIIVIISQPVAFFSMFKQICEFLLTISVLKKDKNKSKEIFVLWFLQVIIIWL